MENKKFSINDKIINIYWDRFLYKLDNGFFQEIKDEYKTLIVLAQLYERNIITKEKLIGQLKSLKKKELTRFKKTYHCTINDKWYNNEPFTEVLKDLYSSEVTFIKLIEILQLYTNKNYNFCINLIIENIIKPLLESFSNSYYSYDYFSQIFETNLLGFPEIKQEGYYTECYECGNKHFEPNSRQTVEEGMKQIIDFLHYYKKGNLTKIPKQLCQQ